LFYLGLAHFRRGDFPRSPRNLERCGDLCRTWQIVVLTPIVSAILGAAYAMARRAEEAFRLVAEAVEEFRSRPSHVRPAFILLNVGMSHLVAGRTD
jgi:hypothetical protein